MKNKISRLVFVLIILVVLVFGIFLIKRFYGESYGVSSFCAKIGGIWCYWPYWGGIFSFLIYILLVIILVIIAIMLVKYFQKNHSKNLKGGKKKNGTNKT